MTKQIESFWGIHENYDHFVFDIWGVVHDGHKRLPGILETITRLKNLGKKVLFLSNMPYPVNQIEFHLQTFGIERNLYEGVYSSGQAAIDYCAELRNSHKISAYMLGEDTSIGRLMITKGIEFTSHLELADVVILTNYIPGSDYKLKEILKRALENKLSVLCTNPDQFYVDGNRLCYAAGSIAHLYEEMGGRVTYIGKPYGYVYGQLQKKYDVTNRILVIGDSLENDILGAQQMNWDSLLVLTGVSAMQDNLSTSAIQPNYILSHF